jgi:arsenite/tail-anchored protein-transporting ATPase
VGEEMLNRVANALFGAEGDPTQFYYHGQSQQISRRGDNYILAISLPFTTHDDVKLTQTGDDLVIEVGWHRRNIVLPTSLARCTATDAVFSGNTLEIIFTAPKPVSSVNSYETAGKKKM